MEYCYTEVLINFTAVEAIPLPLLRSTSYTVSDIFSTFMANKVERDAQLQKKRKKKERAPAINTGRDVATYNFFPKINRCAFQ